jgi:hypothetical protein
MFTIIFCNYYQLQIATFNGSLNFRYCYVRIAVNFPALNVCPMKTEGDRKRYQWAPYETVWSSASKIKMLTI